MIFVIQPGAPVSQFVSAVNPVVWDGRDDQKLNIVIIYLEVGSEWMCLTCQNQTFFNLTVYQDGVFLHFGLTFGDSGNATAANSALAGVRYILSLIHI